MIKAFKIVRADADIEYLASSLDMIDLIEYADISSMIEGYHRGAEHEMNSQALSSLSRKRLRAGAENLLPRLLTAFCPEKPKQ